MVLLKTLLMEDPDDILVWDAHLNLTVNMSFENARYTFFVYNDQIDGKNHWITWDYVNKEVFSSNLTLLDEIYNMTPENVAIVHKRPFETLLNTDLDDIQSTGCITYREGKIEEILYHLESEPTHFNLLKLIVATRRTHDNRRYIKCDARIYYRDSIYYFSAWPNRSEIVSYKSYLDNFFETEKINKSDILFESSHIYVNPNDGNFIRCDTKRVDAELDNFITYDEFFSGKSKEPTDYERRLIQMRKELHINKGKMDAAILKVLHSKPKDRDTLYARLEKEFGMPIVQIKHIFGKIPLDKLVSKKLQECVTDQHP